MLKLVNHILIAYILRALRFRVMFWGATWMESNDYRTRI